MQAENPIYLLKNCVFAYQLQWEVDIYWQYKIHDSRWYSPMQRSLGRQGIDLLKHQFMKPGWSRFQVHTKPEICPQEIVRRMQSHLAEFLQDELPNAVRDNFRIHSLGLLTSRTLRDVAASEVEKEMAQDDNPTLQLFQIEQEIDLSELQSTQHGEYCYNLHVVLDVDSEQIPKSKEFLEMAHDHVLRLSRRRDDRLLQATILPQCIDLTLGGQIEFSPADTALAYMNSLAVACHHRPIFCYSAYVNTLGE